MALTLRLEEPESAALERIKNTLGVATASAALKQLILSFEENQNRLATLASLLQKEQQQANALKSQLTHYFDAQENIAALLGRVPNAKTLAAINTPDAEMASYRTFNDLLANLEGDDDAND